LGFSEEDINFIGISCDVSSEESVITAYNMIMGKFGRIDAVVASAGKRHPRLSQAHSI
jgi:NAD(P)-dependent dehydrogenase (short-subunit alcohol dehydrogenase family)